MSEAFVGFDSAWAGKAPGGIAWATFEGRRVAAFAELTLAGFDKAAHFHGRQSITSRGARRCRKERWTKPLRGR